MARRKRRGKRKTKISIATMAGVAAGILRQAPSGRNLIQDVQEGNFDNLGYDVREIFAGIDQNGQIKFDWLIATYGPMVAGALVSKVIGGKLGINRQISSLPFIKI